MADERRSRKRHLPSWLRAWLLPGTLAALVSLGASGFVPASGHRVGPAAVDFQAKLGRGRTVLEVPPFGSIAASTHAAPLDLELTLTEIDPGRVSSLLEGAATARELTADLERSLRRGAVRAVAQVAVGSVAFGIIAAALLPGRRKRNILAGAVGAAAAMSLVLTTGALTYDLEAFEQPEYSGVLERAPSIISAVQEAGDLSEIRTRFKEAASRLTEVLKVLAVPIASPESGAVTILHISDVHSNPVGLEIARQLAQQFRVAAVLDTGDLTSFGQPAEARIGEIISGLGVPYIFVPGNHDSASNRSSLGAIGNVRILDREVVDVEGVRIMGWADPTFTPRGDLTTDESNRAQRDESPRVAEAVRLESPDVLAVHHPDLARSSLGAVDLVVAGHGHRRRAVETKGTLTLQVGSSGATGLGSFLVEADLPYEAQVLYFREGRAVAVDYVRFWGLGRDFQIERRVLSRDKSLSLVAGSATTRSARGRD